MRSVRRRIAALLVRWSGHLMPVERRQWADAMRGEFEAIQSDHAALEFALGCLRASARQRICRLVFLEGAMTKAMSAGLCILAVFAAHLSGRHYGAETVAGTVFGVMFLVFAAGLALFVAKGASALARLAALLVPVYAVFLAFLPRMHASSDGTAEAVLFRALAIEGIAIWTALLLGAVFLILARAKHGAGPGGRRS